MATGAGTLTQVHIHARVRSRIDGRIRACTAVQRIGPCTAVQRVRIRAAMQHVIVPATHQRVDTCAAHQRVVTRTAVQPVVAVIPGEAVSMIRADEVFDAAQHIARRVATGAAARGQIHIHARVRARVAGRIRTGTTVQGIGPCAADERIVSATALQPVVAVIPGEAVGMIRADEVFNTAQHIARRVATAAGTVTQVYIHARVRARVTGRIRARVATQRIGPCAAGERIVTHAAHQRICIRTAGEAVISIVADERVVACAAGERVVPVTALQRIGRTLPGEAVGMIRTDKVFDAAQHIARRVATRGDAGAQLHIHARVRARVTGRIGARAAVQGIGPRAAAQDVIVRAALQYVGRGIAGEGVGMIRADEIFDAAQHIARRVATRGDAGAQVHVHAHVGARVGGGIRASAAVQGIGPRAALERVVTHATLQHISRTIPGEAVGMIRADEIFDAAQHVARRVATGAGALAQVHVHACVRARVTGRIRTGTAVQGIGPDATVQRVRVVPASELVIPGATHQRVDTCTTHQRVGPRMAVQMVVRVIPGQVISMAGPRKVLNTAQHIARRVATRGGAIAQVHMHARV